jgi:hypothetical protein
MTWASQLFVALVATLTFPMHNHYGTVAKLPFPTDMRKGGELLSARLANLRSIFNAPLPSVIRVPMRLVSSTSGVPRPAKLAGS